jgi:hypothetical protein
MSIPSAAIIEGRPKIFPAPLERCSAFCHPRMPAKALASYEADDRAVAFPGDDHGLPAGLGIVALLDRSVKRIHVHVDDFAGSHLATYYSGSQISVNVNSVGPNTNCICDKFYECRQL